MFIKLYLLVYVVFMIVMLFSVDCMFYYVLFIIDNVKVWLMVELAFICVSRGGAYIAV